MAYNHDFNFYQNDRIDFSISVANVDASGNKTPKTDVSTYTVQLDVKENYGKSTSVMSFSSSGGGITFTDASTMRFVKTSSELASVNSGGYVYDLQMTDASSDNYTYLYGKWNWFPDVTK